MLNIPDYFLWCNKFNIQYSNVKNIISDEYLSVTHKLNAIVRCVSMYRQFLLSILKEKGIILFFPDEIFDKAYELNLIKDAQVWKTFIIDINILNSQTEKAARVSMCAQLIEEYYPKLEYSHNLINTKMQEVSSANYRVSDIEVYKLFGDNLKQNIIECSYNDIGLSEEIYKILIEYFKSVPEIDKVWIFGSKLKLNTRKQTDIDLLISCPLQLTNKIINEMDKLRIPNFIDIKNVHSTVENYVIDNEHLESACLIYTNSESTIGDSYK